MQVEDPLEMLKNEHSSDNYDEESGNMKTISKTPAQLKYETTDDLLSILRQRHDVDITAEDMDPFEYGFRSVVPIPAHYYWDVCRNEEDVLSIPKSIKIWHNSIATMTNVFQWTERRVGWPLARMLGLTKPRFHDVTMFMTKDDWKESERRVAKRREQREMNGKNGILEVGTPIAANER